MPGPSPHQERERRVVKKWIALALVGAVGLGLVGCTQEDKEEAVQPVVQEVMESLLAPITVESQDDNGEAEKEGVNQRLPR